jgi:hypothetical protein
VRLQSEEAAGPAQAARVAHAVATELDWVLKEQTGDEDPRVVALEAFTAQEAAERAAWLSAVELRPLGADSSSFVAYRGPRGETKDFSKGWTEKHTSTPLPLVTHDQPGHGHVWASLVSGCAVQHEDESTAGHVWSALKAATTRGNDRQSVQASTMLGQVGLLGAQSSRTAGAEDALAEQLARSLLRFHRDATGISELRSELAASLPKVPTWTFALQISTSGHPSWLTGLPTEKSLLTLAPDSARQALELFAGSPLELDVLTTQGAPQGHRLAARLGHLLSGLREQSFPCLPPSSRVQRMPASGEYAVEAPVGTPAVLMYVLDGRFAGAVRRVATTLGRPGGWLERSLPAATFQVRVSSSGLGSSTTLSALAFSIAAESDEQLTNTVAQVRELVRRLTVANLGPGLGADPVQELSPQERMDRLFRTVSDESALLDELLSRALATAPLIYVKPIQSN